MRPDLTKLPSGTHETVQNLGGTPDRPDRLGRANRAARRRLTPIRLDNVRLSRELMRRHNWHNYYKIRLLAEKVPPPVGGRRPFWLRG